jgi:hypothetical protein
MKQNLWLSLFFCGIALSTFAQTSHKSYVYGIVGGANESGNRFEIDEELVKANIVKDRVSAIMPGIGWGSIRDNRRYREISLVWLRNNIRYAIADSSQNSVFNSDYKSNLLQIQFERGIVLTDPLKSGRQFFLGYFFRPQVGRHRISPKTSNIMPVDVAHLGIKLGLTSRIMLDLTPKWWLSIGCTMGVFSTELEQRQTGNQPNSTTADLTTSLDAQLRLGVVYRWY